MIQRAMRLGSVLLEAGKRSARKRATMLNAVVWALPPDLITKDKKVKKLYLALAAAPLPVRVMIYGMSIWLQDFFRKVKRFLDAHSKDWKFPNQERTRLMRKPIVLISSSHAACKFMDSFMILQKEETLDSPKTTNSQLSATIEEQAICYVKAFCNRRPAA